MNKFGQLVSNYNGSISRFNNTEINIEDIEGVSFSGENISFNGVSYVSSKTFNELLNRFNLLLNSYDKTFENTREKIINNNITYYLIPKNLSINLYQNIVSLKEEGKAYYIKNGNYYDVYIYIDINNELQYIKGYLVEYNRWVLLRFLNNPLELTLYVDINNNYDFIKFI